MEGPERLEVLGGPEGLPGSVEDSECLIFPEHRENFGGPERLKDSEGLGGPGGLQCPGHNKKQECLECPEHCEG